jgi:hypothetical protein
MADENKRTPKIWRLTPESPAHIAVAEDEITMAANAKTFISVSSSGIIIRGNVSMANMGPGNRVGGFWVKMIEPADMIPKTILTPIPTIFPYPPMGFLVSAALGVTVGLAFLVA